jgi:VWFA-related protein
MRTLFCFLLFAAAAASQDSGFKISTTTQLVVIDVAAKDKGGNPILDLKADDFTVTEDGKALKISVFEFQRLEDRALPPMELKTRASDAAVSAAGSIAPSRPGEVKYKDRRLLVLFFDQAGMPVADQIRAQQAALRYINGHMTESDMVAVMTYSATMNVAQDFTNDRDVLVKAIKGLTIGDTGQTNGSTGSDADADTGSAYTQDDTEFNVFNTDRKLAALTTAVKMLSSLPEKKALVYFASGMTLTGIDNQAQLRSTINAAIRSNVSFYPVDARGLAATAPIGDATQGSPGGQAMYTGASQRASRDTFQAQQDSLYTLASDTGGIALLDSNDLALGIVQAHKGISSYYILGYYSTNTALDGRYRRLKVKINRTVDAKLDYRNGYFASKEFKKFDSTDREQQLQEALMLENPVTDLSIALEVNYFRQARDRYFVPVSIKIPGSDIELAKKGGAESTARFHRTGEGCEGNAAGHGARRDHGEVKGRQHRPTWAAQPAVRYGVFAAARDLHAEDAGARERDRKNGRLRDAVYRAGFDRGPAVPADQFRGAEQSAREGRCGGGIGRARQETDRGKSAGAGQCKADSECDPRVPQGAGDVRVPGSLSTERERDTVHGGERELFPGQDEGVRDGSTADYAGTEREVEGCTGDVFSAPREVGAGTIHVPDIGAKSGCAEVRDVEVGYDFIAVGNTVPCREDCFPGRCDEHGIHANVYHDSFFTSMNITNLNGTSEMCR